MPKEYYKYLPFGRLLTDRINEVFPSPARGSKKDPRRQQAAKVLGVHYQTLSTWCVGNSIPRKLEDRLAVGAFLGWYDPDTDEGLKDTLDYFTSDKCKSTPEERALHMRSREARRKVSRMQKGIRRSRKLKRERQKGD